MMLEKIIYEAFGEFIKYDTPELIELCNTLADEILKKENPSENFILDRLHDVGTEYESVAFHAGFLACVNCFRSFLFEEIVGKTLNN